MILYCSWIGIWQFLKGLHVDDLVTELVQNDLDDEGEPCEDHDRN